MCCSIELSDLDLKITLCEDQGASAFPGSSVNELLLLPQNLIFQKEANLPEGPTLLSHVCKSCPQET